MYYVDHISSVFTPVSYAKMDCVTFVSMRLCSVVLGHAKCSGSDRYVFSIKSCAYKKDQLASNQVVGSSNLSGRARILLIKINMLSMLKSTNQKFINFQLCPFCVH